MIGARRTIVGKARRPYQGPGDLVGGASAWGSCARAYSAAFAATSGAMMDLVDQAGANIVTINCFPTGFVNLAVITAWASTHAVTTINVTKLYDQTGTGNHFTQATLANMPTLQLNTLNGLPTMVFQSSTGAVTLAAAAVTFNQPFSMSCVYKRTANTANTATVLAGQGSSVAIGPGTSGLAEITSPGALTVSAAESIFHSVQGVFNGASSVVVADGTSASGNPGVSNITAVALRIGRSSGGTTLDGAIAEIGIWGALAFSSAQYGNLTTNQRNAYLGYNF